MILPVVAERTQFDSRLLILPGLGTLKSAFTELGPISTNQIADLFGLGTLKSANYRAGTTINQSDYGSDGSL